MRQQLVRREGVNLDSSDEDLAKTKLHLRHSTGVIGTQHTWSDDPEINELWEQLAAIKIESMEKGSNYECNFLKVSRMCKRPLFDTL